MGKLLNLAKFESVLKNRFVFDQSYSIYGGFSGLFDFGPLGCALQNNLIKEWRKFFILKDQMLEIDCSILTPEIALKASGHLSKFSDLMVRDSATNESFRVDHLLKSEIEKLIKEKNSNIKDLNETLKRIENLQIDNLAEIDAIISKYNIKSPVTKNELTQTTHFNLMFQTQFGPSSQTKSFMRPETAQGIFANFKRLYEYNQKKMPLVVAQVGKSFRNEISPRSGLLRQREFLMAEIEHFVHPSLKYEKYEKFKHVENLEICLLSIENQQMDDSRRTTAHSLIKLREAVDTKIIKSEILAYYLGRVYLFAVKCGINKDKIRFRQHLPNEMAHYANECWDLECETSHGWIECAGVADRCDYDLKQHMKYSTADLTIEKQIDINKLDDDEQIKVEIHEENLIKFVKSLSEKESEILHKYIETHKEKFQKEIKSLRLNEKTKKIKFKLSKEEFVEVDRKDIENIIQIETNNSNKIDGILPHVIEPSFGIGRILYTILEHNFKSRPDDPNRFFFSFPSELSPYKCSILPLNHSDEEFQPLINKISDILTENEITHKKDDGKGSIGKRYWRVDEAGIKYGITLDYQTLKDQSTITLRERDSREQIRIKIEDLCSTLIDLDRNKIKWDELVKKLKVNEN